MLNNLILIVRDEIFKSNLNLYTFPIEILILIIVSFVFILTGSISSYTNFEEISISKQKPELKIKTIIHKNIGNSYSKGGMINYFLDN